MGLVMGCCPDPAERVTDYMEHVPHMALLQFKTSKFQSILDRRDFGPMLLFLLTDESTEELSNLPQITSWICKASPQVGVGVASPFLSQCFWTDRWLGFGLAWCLGLRHLRGQVMGVSAQLSVLSPDGVVLVDPEYLKERRGKAPTPSLSRGLLVPRPPTSQAGQRPILLVLPSTAPTAHQSRCPGLLWPGAALPHAH